MPLWVIHHPEEAFHDAGSKKSLSEAITELYVNVGLPAFYVVVIFNQVPALDIFVGGRVQSPQTPFIRFQIDQIAVRMEESAYSNWIARIDKLLKPHVQDKGYDWEYHITETDRRLWKINGLVPPPFRSESEKLWVKENRAIPWEEDGVSEPANTKI